MNLIEYLSLFSVVACSLSQLPWRLLDAVRLQLTLFFFFIFPKCFYGLRLCSPTFFECQLPIAISWHLLWVCLLEGKPYALGRMTTWSLLSGRAAYGLSWRLDFYVPVSLCKLLLFQSFFCLYSVDNSTFINHWQDSHPDAKHLREKD